MQLYDILDSVICSVTMYRRESTEWKVRKETPLNYEAVSQKRKDFFF